MQWCPIVFRIIDGGIQSKFHPHPRYVNNVGFDDVEKNSLDNDCHHQKGGDCECMNT